MAASVRSAVLFCKNGGACYCQVRTLLGRGLLAVEKIPVLNMQARLLCDGNEIRAAEREN
jgi:hypothetical protein